MKIQVKQQFNNEERKNEGEREKKTGLVRSARTLFNVVCVPLIAFLIIYKKNRLNSNENDSTAPSSRVSFLMNFKQIAK